MLNNLRATCHSNAPWQKTQSTTPYSHTSKAAPQQQQLLLRRALLAGTVCIPLATPLYAAEQTVLPQNLDRVFTGQNFLFAYPKSFAIAFDRTDRVDNGTAVLAGNFIKYLTFTIEREKPPQGAASVLAGSSQDVQLLLTPRIDPVTTLDFEFLGSRRREGPGGRQFVDLEYILERCPGEVQEGRGGVLRCLNASGGDVRTFRRRHLTAATVVGDYLYYADASASEQEWDDALPLFRAMVDSFQV